MVGAPTFAFVAVPLALAVSTAASVTAEAQQPVAPEPTRRVRGLRASHGSGSSVHPTSRLPRRTGQVTAPATGRAAVPRP